MGNAKRRQFIANLPSEARTIFTPGWRGYWQVFGLAGMADQLDRGFYWPIFPVSEKTSGIWVFDPAYRCGAVPDLHRVPFNVPLERHQQTNHKIEGCPFRVNPNIAVLLARGIAPKSVVSVTLAQDGMRAATTQKVYDGFFSTRSMGLI